MADLAFILFELPWYAFFLYVVRHAVQKWGKPKAATFFVPAVLWGWILEIATQNVFGRYQYGDGFLLYFLNAPVAVGLAWAALIYAGQWMATEKLRLQGNRALVAAAVPLLALDFLVLEPLAHAFGYWIWTPQGFWFGAPVNNFFGWFWVVVLFLLAHRWIERKKWNWKQKLAANLSAIPILVAALIVLLKGFNLVFGKI